MSHPDPFHPAPLHPAPCPRGLSLSSFLPFLFRIPLFNSCSSLSSFATLFSFGRSFQLLLRSSWYFISVGPLFQLALYFSYSFVSLASSFHLFLHFTCSFISLWIPFMNHPKLSLYSLFSSSSLYSFSPHYFHRRFSFPSALKTFTPIYVFVRTLIYLNTK